MFMDSSGWKFNQGTVGIACLCLMMPGNSAEKTGMAGNDSNIWYHLEAYSRTCLVLGLEWHRARGSSGISLYVDGISALSMWSLNVASSAWQSQADWIPYMAAQSSNSTVIQWMRYKIHGHLWPGCKVTEHYFHHTLQPIQWVGT